MVTDNAFAELGLPPDATEREVKAAWRRLASQWHPDRNGSADASARMQRINQAFEHIRRAGFVARPAAAEPPTAPSSDAAPPEDSRRADTDAASSETAASADEAWPQRALRRKIRLSLEEAAAGCIKVLRGKVTDTCADCAGVGYHVLGGHCAQCGGSGLLRKHSFFGWSSTATECDACLGTGIARQTCLSCDGTGKHMPRAYKLSVRMPPGIRHGDLLHVDGRRVRASGPGADVEIRVEVEDHAFFKLDDDGTIRCDMPVDGFAWIANRRIKVPTVGGFQPLQLSREHLSYRLEGQGFPKQRRGARGDQIVTLSPIFPATLSTDQQILLDQLSATGSGADGEALDERLREWNRGLRAWEKGL